MNGILSNIDKNFDEAKKNIKSITGYDSEQFSYQLLLWTRELKYFYNNLVSQQTGKPESTYYNVPPQNRPKEGQVAYFNLRRGYPKELYDGHWCYILKDYPYKQLIVPITSVKDKSSPNSDFEVDIIIKDFINTGQSRLQISDMRTVDLQRINEGRGVYDVVTDFDYVKEEIVRILSLQDQKEMLKLI